MLFNRLHAQHSVRMAVAPRVWQSPPAYGSRPLLDTSGKLPGMLALFAVLGPVRPRKIEPFLPSFLS